MVRIRPRQTRARAAVAIIACLYKSFQQRLTEHVRSFLQRKYGLELPSIVVEQPPKIEFGEYALPLAFELAKKLRRPPRKIAEEIVAEIGPIPGFTRLEVAGAGYINAHADRAALAAEILRGETAAAAGAQKILVEHTSINPNKAAHIGHLRNAILGDTFVRLLRSANYRVAIQNYIDNTGVQVADVVVGYVHLEKKSKAEIEQLVAADPRLDFTCWDLYARVSQWYEEDKSHLQVRLDTLHAIERGGNDQAAIADLISTTILRRHLETMDRLGIEYDFLPRESEILHLHFWDAAFEQMKQKGVLEYETEGKNKGCWVMLRPSARGKKHADLTDEDMKIIVRSNGTVTYVGKDIAYHLWKFGLLGRDFGYRRFFRYPNGHEVWISAEQGEEEHPHFGGVEGIYNVIDARQNEAQNTVVDALRALGYDEQAARYTHFSYEMVALTPCCAIELGYVLSEDDMGRPFVEVSGRKGFGVKADDLLDKLTAAAQREVDVRHPQLAPDERQAIATQIAVGALRYFMLKFTKMSVIAFDFKDALSFEGETGPYAQYAAVRASSIFRKAGTTAEQFLASFVETQQAASLQKWLAEDDMWELWLTAAKLETIVEQCIATTEPAYAAKYAFQLAQHFSNFYHRHHILTEADEGKKKFLMATAAVARRELVRVLELMGITVPPVM
jgi:arginyl-tRNA synthetase